MVSERSHQEAEQRTSALLSRFNGRIPAVELQGMESLVAAGEPGVAFENFCGQLYEYDGALEPAELAELAEVGELMKIDPRYWQLLSIAPPRPDLRP